jgi:tetratricopeptide (TPR) repeat protein
MMVLETTARGAAAVLLLAGIVLAVRLGAADLAQKGKTLDGLERAVRLAPGNAEYHRWLGVMLLTRDPQRSEREFREAVRLNPWDADGRMHLGTLLEAKGQMQEAERQLIETAKVDATYLPRWALANFEFRQGKMPEFWTWARAAVPMSYGDRSALFDLAAATGETEVAERLGLAGDEINANYLGWAITKSPAGEVRRAALRVAQGQRPERALLQWACDRLLDLGEAGAALEVWNAGVKSRMILAGAAARGRITNGAFTVVPSGSGFDWAVDKPNGGAVVRETERGGLRIRFTGDQAEQGLVLWQRVAVSPGASYRVRMKYRTIGVKQNSGLKWIVGSAKEQLAAMDGYLWAEDESAGDFQFRVPNDVQWVRLALKYERPQGEMRMDGDVVLESVELMPL